jgi:hypothetical protein
MRREGVEEGSGAAAAVSILVADTGMEEEMGEKEKGGWRTYVFHV